ncbi:MAG: cache domain-containing protein [Cytophagales bacterium]|nr:cache domain-containing protein [Cytophagales bacterium]
MATQRLRPNRQLTVALITLIVVGVLFAYYFLVHTKNQEGRIVSQAFNNLSTLSLGFQDNIRSHKTAYENFLNGINMRSVNELVFSTYDSLYRGHLESYRRENYLMRTKMFLRSKNYNYRRQYYTQTSSKKEIEKRIVEDLQKVMPKSGTFKLTKVQRVPAGGPDDSDPNVALEISRGKISFTSTITSTASRRNSTLKLWFSTDLESIISSTFNNRIFEEFILISGDSMVYQTMDYKFKKFNYDTLKVLNREINYMNNIVQKFVKNGSSGHMEADGSLVSKALSSPNLYDINVSEIRYKLFLNQFELDGEFWVLGGFMNSDFYNRQKRSVEPTILLIAISVLLFILLASQLIKLFILSEFEQFFIRNIIISVVSITVGSSMLVIGLMSTVSYWTVDRNEKDLELEILNDHIKESFFDELSDVINFIKTCDNTLSAYNWLSPPTRISRSDFLDTFNIEHADIEKFDNTYWISKKGDEMVQVYEATRPVSYLNLERREYFRSIRDGHGYVYSDFFSSGPIRFYFQPLKSWVTGKKTVVVSIESAGARLNLDSIPVVAAMATQFRSLQKCQLSPGYGFALIDEEGKVLFHNDDRLSLSENFLKECSDVKEIQSAMLSRASFKKSITYHNKKYRIYLRPVQNMPVYLITYHDREIFRLPGVLIFYYAILFSLTGLISVGFWILFLSVFNYHSSKLKFKSLILDWAVPDVNKLPWYWKATIVNTLAIIIICIAEVVFSKSLTNKFIFLFLAANFVFPVNYFMLRKCTERDLTVFRLGKILKLIFSDRVILVFVGLLVVFNVFLIHKDYTFTLNIVLYQLALLSLLFVPLFLHFIKFKSSFLKKVLDIKLAHAYTAFTISWLILVSIIPSIFYFGIAHQNELNIWKKFDQLQIVREMYRRDMEKASRDEVHRGFYLVLNEKDTTCEMPEHEKESLLINTIFHHLRLPVGSLSDLTKSFVPEIRDTSEKWAFRIADNTGRRSLTAGYQYLGKRADLQFLRPPNLSNIDAYKNKYPDAGPWKAWSGSIVLAAILVLVVLIYIMLYYLLNKIFGFEFLISGRLVSSSRQQVLSSVTDGNDVFVVGLPAPDFDELKGKVARIDDPGTEAAAETAKGKGQKLKVEYIDLQDRRGAASADLVDRKLVVIDHFEYSCNDPDRLRQNLALVEEIKNQGKQVVIFSSISPRQVERIYSQFGKSGPVRDPEKQASFMNDADLWVKLLKSFHVLHYRLAQNNMDHFVAEDRHSLLQTQLTKLIRAELSASTYFKGVEHLVAQKYNLILEQWKDRDITRTELKTLKEEMILYIQDIAQSYYFALWNTCYKKQRFLLYDLAFDNIANFKDGATVLFLLKKGILKFDNGVHIMNDSFRHFVIDVLSQEDARAMRREMEQKGAWNSTKVVLFIVAISLLVFIFMVNKGSINQMSAIITGVVALIGALLRIFSFVPKSDGPT